MAIPLSLKGLTPREAITDTAYRLARSFDHNDINAFNSAISEDAVLELNITEPLMFTGISNIRAATFDRVVKMDTSHMLSNIRVDVQQGAKEATLQCYTLSQHCPLGMGKDVKAPKYLAGAEFMFEMDFHEGDGNGDGLWKIRRWIAGLVWAEGDESLILSN
ncbi:hypothetical protein N7478_009040 [Penicillium angulare]|uniref:uncharacterized protein n=1 Tax=Penicillium angulare TaxID=116970 RepID=UPI00253FECE9|nr:uncharacterized protein N7478_009040 [Penicillium angulare]KAJ5273915.1 hypothetical protein N7478_009040 [Penicillium angulare]